MKKEVKNGIILTISVLVFLIIVYFVIAFIKGEIKSNEQDTQTDQLSLSYSNMITASNIFNQNEEEYYVILFSNNDAFEVIKNTLSSYSGDKKLYKVNIDEPINRSVKGKNVNEHASTYEELKVDKTTLIKINNKQIVSFITNTSEIVNALK